MGFHDGHIPFETDISRNVLCEEVEACIPGQKSLNQVVSEGKIK